MANNPMPEPTEAELRILHIFWGRNTPLRFTEIAEHLCAPPGGLARTTVATTLKVMLEKGFVSRVTHGGKTAWRAKVSREIASQRSVRNLVQRLFEGSAKNLVAHLVAGGALSKSERAEITKLIEEADAS